MSEEQTDTICFTIMICICLLCMTTCAVADGYKKQPVEIKSTK